MSAEQRYEGENAPAVPPLSIINEIKSNVSNRKASEKCGLDRQDHIRHVVQFYEQESFLLDGVRRLLGAALCAGESAVVIATREHREALEESLVRSGLDLPAIRERGRYVAVDSAEMLTAIMPAGRLDEQRFARLVGDMIESARKKAEPGHPQVAIFGEMVALLWAKEQREAALELEKFWNRLAQNRAFHLHCGYSLGGFQRAEDDAPFLAICSEHSEVIPAESYAISSTEDERRRSIAALQQRAQALDDQTALRQSEERFHLLVESVQDYAIYLLDTEGRVVSWNRGAERMKGYTASEITGQHFSIFYTREAIAAGKPESMLRTAAKEGRAEDEGWRVRKDGSRFWASAIVTALRNPEGILTGYAKITRDTTQQREYEHSLRRITGMLLSLQDEERRRLARELHDSTAQTLTAVVINLAVLENLGVGARNAKIAKTLSQTQSLADQAAQEVRSFSHLLHPPDLDTLGLVRATRWFVQRFTERSGIQVHLDLPESDLRLPPEVEITLFRIMQEGLTNIHRHSGSPTAAIRLEVGKTESILKIEDQGRGISPAILKGGQRAAKAGVGLAGMQERVRQLSGRFEIDSGSQGTAITVLLPLSDSRGVSGFSSSATAPGV